MSLASTLSPTRRRVITNINFILLDPILNPSITYTKTLFIPKKPCTVLSYKTKLLLRSDMSINYDNRVAPFTNWFAGNITAFGISKYDTFDDPIIFPNTLDTESFWEPPSDYLIDYGYLKVDSPTLVNPFISNGSLTINDLSLTGTIEGPIVAPAGTGDVGPLVWDLPTSLVEAELVMPMAGGGGTTVDKYNSSGPLNLTMTGNDDRIIMSGRYIGVDNVQSGCILTGTIEFLIEY